MNLGPCPACAATVIWSKTPAGKKIPLNPIPILVAQGDPTPDDGGCVRVTEVHEIHFRTCAKRNPRIRR